MGNVCSSKQIVQNPTEMHTMAGVPVPPLEDIITQLHGPDGIAIKDRSFHFVSYQQTAVGSEIVDWMLRQKWCTGRNHAIEV